MYRMSCEIKTRRRRWDVATQERKVCNMEIEIVTFVVKGSAKLTFPTDWQWQIHVESRRVALRRVFDLKHRGIHVHLTEITLKLSNSQSVGYWWTKRRRCIYMWSWSEMLTASYPPRARTVWIPLRTSIEICRLGEGHSLCPWGCR